MRGRAWTCGEVQAVTPWGGVHAEARRSETPTSGPRLVLALRRPVLTDVGGVLSFRRSTRLLGAARRTALLAPVGLLAVLRFVSLRRFCRALGGFASRLGAGGSRGRRR